MIATKDIPIRDPFIVSDPENFKYAMFGTTDTEHTWEGTPEGFDVYVSTDLENWEGPFPAFRPDPDFWADRNFWAPEVHYWRGEWYMFASFKSADRCRGTQILRSEGGLLGPYVPFTDAPVTPADMECLDGTLYVDPAGKPWMIFSHELVQCTDGTFYALPLSDDLSTAIGEPVRMFSASESSYVTEYNDGKISGYVTDGPFMYTSWVGDLYMIWSSFNNGVYTQNYSRSLTGTLTGPWKHCAPLYKEDGGHGMFFRAIDGRLLMVFHTPNTYMEERPKLLEIRESEEGLGFWN